MGLTSICKKGGGGDIMKRLGLSRGEGGGGTRIIVCM